MLSALKRNDEVVTTGGLIGRIHEVGDKVVTLEIAPNVRVRVERAQVTGISSYKPSAKKDEQVEASSIVEQTQSFGPILILLVLIVSFLYLHFTNGSGLTRIYLARRDRDCGDPDPAAEPQYHRSARLVPGGIRPNQNSAGSRLAGRDASADAR